MESAFTPHSPCSYAHYASECTLYVQYTCTVYKQIEELILEKTLLVMLSRYCKDSNSKEILMVGAEGGKRALLWGLGALALPFLSTAQLSSLKFLGEGGKSPSWGGGGTAAASVSPLATALAYYYCYLLLVIVFSYRECETNPANHVK